MAKRRADTELNHDNWDREDDQTEEVKGDFKRASEDELAKRKIKVARRRGTDSVTMGGSDSPSVFKNFSGFGGVGAGANAASSKLPSFDFAAKTPPGSIKKMFESTSFKMTSPSTGTTGSSLGSTFNFASPCNKENSKPGEPNKLANGVVEESSASNKEGNTEGKNTAYLANLRVLNEGVLKWIKQHLDANININLNPVFDDYRKHFDELQKRYNPKFTNSSSSSSSLASDVAICPKNGAASAENQRQLLSAEPAGVSTELNPKETESQQTKSPKTSTENKGALFSFGATDSTKPKDAASTFSFSSSQPKSNDPSSTFSFGLKTSEEKKESTPSSLFSTTDAKPKAPSLFSFASSDSQSKPALPFGNSDSKTKDSLSTFSFASSDSKGAGGGVVGSSSSAFTFGSSTGPLTFGSKTSTPSTTSGFSFGGATSTFSFGTTPGGPLPTIGTISKPEEAEEEAPPKPEVKEVKEENSFYEKKCKLFYKKEGAFTEKGVGTIFLKPAGDDKKKTQLIVRAATNLGNVLLNIVLNSSLPTQRMGKNNVLIVCIPNPPVDTKGENNVPVSMLIRVKTAEDANELLKQIDDHKGE